MEQPLEGGQRSANTVGLVPDGRGPGADGRLDARAIDGRLARGLPERDAPDLRVDLPVGPAARVEPRHDDTDAPGPQLDPRDRANPRRSWRASPSRRTALVSIRASARARATSYATVPRSGTPRTCAVRPVSSTRERLPAASRSSRSGVATGASASPATSIRSPRRSPRALAPPSRGASASLASTPRAARPRRRPRPAADASSTWSVARASGHPPRSGAPGDLAVGELRAALHRAREARHRPGKPQVRGAPELAEPEALVLEARGRPRAPRDRRGARSRAPRRGRPERGPAGRAGRPASSGRRRRSRPEARAPAGATPPSPARSRRIVSPSARAERPRVKRERARSSRSTSPRTSPLALWRVASNVTSSEVEPGTWITPPVIATSRSGALPMRLARPWRSPSSAAAPVAPPPPAAIVGSRHQEPDRRGLPARRGKKRARGLDRLGLDVGRPAALRGQPKAPENDP